MAGSRSVLEFLQRHQEQRRAPRSAATREADFAFPASSPADADDRAAMLAACRELNRLGEDTPDLSSPSEAFQEKLRATVELGSRVPRPRWSAAGESSMFNSKDGLSLHLVMSLHGGPAPESGGHTAGNCVRSNS